MHGDEPDNAQRLPDRKGYGPPVPPEKIIEDYEKIVREDPSRPVLLNLGQGVAWDGWIGRGVRTNHPEDYPKYLKGCDIASFDIYPVVSTRPQVTGRLWFVPKGVRRLRQWAHDKRVVWNCIECTRIANPNLKPTPVQVKAEVWMSIIHGSRGLIYFVHQFKPKFIEAGLLADPEMLEAVTKINNQIHSLARVINSLPIRGVISVISSNPNVPINITARKHEGFTYIFAVSLYKQDTEATFTVKGLPQKATAEVIDEARRLRVLNSKFIDHFTPYAVHLYRIK